MTKKDSTKKVQKAYRSSGKPVRESSHYATPLSVWDCAAILETLTDNSSDVIFLYDMDRHLRYVTPSFKALTGYSIASLRKKHFINYFHPDDSEIMLYAWDRVFSGREYRGRFRFITKRKAAKWCSALWKPLLDIRGRQVGVIRKEEDITERKQAETALLESEEKYRTILETMEEGFYELDLRGNYTFVNNAACRQFGYEYDEFIGMNYRRIASAETARHLYEVFHQVFETGEPALLMDFEVIRKDGSVRNHLNNAVLIRDSSGQPKGFRVLARDITERKRAEAEKSKLEQQLLQAQKMESVGRLAGGVAHDYNNMLSVILGYVDLIKNNLSSDDPFFKNVLEIERAALHSKDITHKLLAFSRKEIIAPKSLNLNGLIAGTQKTLIRLIGEDLELYFHPVNNLWKIKFDRSQMEQILVNLAVNARDAMPNGGKLTIETNNIRLDEAYCRVHLGFSPGDYVQLVVSDDGAGMGKDTLAHVFEPFFTTKETGKGTGLGLATVYGIVKQNDGFINVYSEPGRGTTFKIYIRRSMEEGDVTEETEEALPASGTGTILVVEDDDMVRAMTIEMLEVIGYTTLSTGNPLEALSFFERGDTHIDLVITDVVMPKMSGKELIDRIEAIRPGVKALFMSGYTTNVIADRGVLKEGVHFIQKPFSMSDLTRKAYDAINDR
ncbi:MAG: hypothetical protein A2W19_02155 [Spirochaetes bacterium RBG_16_49_21]|nr:MAG: hypothetical protein A2W19_02155 [Spirochaetes bacterium RBG_16_49_21]